jgi:hypothetical protein
LKACWPLIVEDFYKLFSIFHNSEVCLRSINSSYITLIPKKMDLRLSLTIDQFHC